MSNETLFYVCGVVLAVSAVTVSIVGLKVKSFPGKALPLVILWFAIFVGGATTFAVLHAQDEENAKAAELQQAGKKIEKAETSGPYEKEGAPGGEAKKPSGGAETTLDVEASETALAFNTTQLTAKAGTVTIDFKNPSAIAHNVVIEKDGKELAGFEPLAEGEETESADLEPGTYTFLCTVPGHAAAGMEGTLTVK
jgi:plastocyanin